MRKVKQMIKIAFVVGHPTVDLHQTQSLFQANPLNKELIDQEKRCLLNLWSVLDREEILLQQKSRATWLALGDRNSSFFSNMMKTDGTLIKFYPFKLMKVSWFTVKRLWRLWQSITLSKCFVHLLLPIMELMIMLPYHIMSLTMLKLISSLLPSLIWRSSRSLIR